MPIRLLAVLALLPWLLPAADPPPLLQNDVLRIALDADHGGLVVTDLRRQRVWRQWLVEKVPGARQRSIGVDGPRLRLSCGLAAAGGTIAPFTLAVELHRTEPAFTITFTRAGEGTWPSLRYPYVFACADAQARIVYPHAEGMLLPVRVQDADFLRPPGDCPLYGGTAAYLPCTGLVDLADGAGLLAIHDTFEAALMRWPDIAIGGTVVTAQQTLWRGDKQRFDRPLRLTIAVSDQGGHVALAKRYRAWHQEQGRFRTLKDKARAIPAIDRLVGGMVMWFYGRDFRNQQDWCRNMVAVAEALRADGVERAAIGYAPPPLYDAQGGIIIPPELPPAVQRVNDMGFLTYRYDQYRDAFDPAGGAAKEPYHANNRDAYPHDIVRTAKGDLLRAFGPQSGVISTGRAVELARRHIPDDCKAVPWTARFMDCYGSVSFSEGEDWSPDHPRSIWQARSDREAMLALVNGHGLVTGTECGLDYLLPWCHWFDGTMTLVSYMGTDLGHVGDQAKKEGGVQAAGDGWPVSLSTRYRIPFWSLAHHDEAVPTWRWEDGMNAGMDQDGRRWQRKNLWNVLHGSIPLYRIFRKDFDRWRPRIAHTARYVGGWARTVGYDAMLTHRFLDATRSVQETTFSSGVGVVVNFGDAPHPLPGGTVVPPYSYRTFATAASPRRYEPPAVAEYADPVPAP